MVENEIVRGEQTVTGLAAKILANASMHVVANVLVCAAYIQGALDKIIDYPGALQEMESFHLHPAGLFAPLVIITEIVGPTLVISGRFRWLGALWLGGFTAIANLVANAYWQLSGPAREGSENAFYEHWGLVGAFLLIALFDLRKQVKSRL